MAAVKRYKGAPFVLLEDYLPAKLFRTVLPESVRYLGGRHEVRVEMELGRDFIKSLKSDPTLDGMTVYGFTRETPALCAKFGESLETDRWQCLVSLFDWKNRFLLLWRGPGEREDAAFVTPDEVRFLLEHCLRAPIPFRGSVE